MFIFSIFIIKFNNKKINIYTSNQYHYMETIIGPPGTGKTHEIEKMIETKRDYIYMTYNANMAESARERIDRHSRRIGTFHSILSGLLGLSNFIGTKEIKEFMDQCNLKYHDFERFIRWYDATVQGMKTPAKPMGEKINFLFLYSRYTQFKEKIGKIDYTDIIKLASERTFETDNLYIDEAQDLTPLMWKVVDNFNAEKTIAGDPHQSIYSHMGVDVNEFVRRMKNVKTLDVSYRYGDNLRMLADRALSNGRVMQVKYKGIGITEIQKHDLNGFLQLEGQKAILCRSNALAEYIANKIDAVVMPINPGHAYKLGWTDKVFEVSRIIKKYPGINEEEKKFISKYSTYFGSRQVPLDSFKNGWDYGLKGMTEREKKNVLTLVKHDNYPAVFVDTIHATKGLEFDHVFIYLDEPDPYRLRLEEKRVIYTGITRAKKSLDYAFAGFYASKFNV